MIVLQENKTGYRLVLLMASGIFAVFGSRNVHFSGAGPLGVLTLAFVAALRWRKEISPTAEVYYCCNNYYLLCNARVKLVKHRILRCFLSCHCLGCDIAVFSPVSMYPVPHFF